MSRGGRMPAPPGQLGRGGPSKITTQEPPKPKPKPQVEASPTTQLFAELARRQQEGGVTTNTSRPQIPNEFGKADYGVNKNVSFGGGLRKAQTNVDGKPLQPRPTPEPKQYAYKSAAGKQAVELPSLSWRVEGPEEVKDDDEVEFKMTCKNKETKATWDYNPRNLEAYIWPEGQRSVTTEARILKASTGVFVLQFGKLKPGEWEMNVWIDCDKERRPLYAETSPIPLYVEGDELTESVQRNISFSVSGHGFNGGEVCKPLSFKIFTKDDSQLPVEIALEKLKVNLSQPGKIFPVNVEEVSKGCFNASYTPQQDGEWKVVITYQGQDVVEHKMNITGKSEGSQCIVTKAPKQVKINTPSHFIMQARDRMGAVMATGGEVFKSSVSGPPDGCTNFMVKDLSNGTYEVHFTLTKVGDYDFTINLRGKAVDGSPVNVQCR